MGSFGGNIISAVRLGTFQSCRRRSSDIKTSRIRLFGFEYFAEEESAYG